MKKILVSSAYATMVSGVPVRLGFHGKNRAIRFWGIRLVKKKPVDSFLQDNMKGDGL